MSEKDLKAAPICLCLEAKKEKLEMTEKMIGNLSEKKKFFLIYGVKIIIIFDFKIDGLNGRIEISPSGTSKKWTNNYGLVRMSKEIFGKNAWKNSKTIERSKFRLRTSKGKLKVNQV